MPRTKAVKKKASVKLLPWVAKALEEMENATQSLKVKLERNETKCLIFIRTHLERSKYSIPGFLLTKTIAELMEHPVNWSGNTTNASVTQILDITTKSKTTKKKPLTRSSSFGDDEGYLTAEGGNGYSGGRMSRARSKAEKTARTSRSLSTKNQSTGVKSASDNKFKTPAYKNIPPTTFGTVTPKIKPNTPQVLLRRPKQGEVALSMQGSPLMTGNVVTDNVANINIPLDDGRLLSIQPQRGLRMSQIPFLDMETKRQLETLRDNLNKVCALSAIKN